MTTLLRKYKLEVIGILIGAIAGYLYWKFVGCANGTCKITSKPLNSSLYGAIMGFFVLSIFKKEEQL